MGQNLILFSIILFYFLRAMPLLLRKKRIHFLLFSFVVFTFPFELTKGLTEYNPNLASGAFGATVYITIPLFLSAILIPKLNLKKINFRFNLKNWILIIGIFIIISLFNPINLSLRGTCVFALFFFSHIICFMCLTSFLEESEVFSGVYDGLFLLTILQGFLAICYPLLGINAVTGLFHTGAEDAATRHGSDRAGAVGVFTHPGGLALFSIIAFSFFIACFFYKYKKRNSLIGIIGCIITIVLTYSRTSYLAFVFISFALIYIHKNSHKDIFSIKSLLKFLIPSILLLGWLIFLSPFSNTFLESDSGDQYDNRYFHWMMALNIFEKSPIFGVGMNAHLAYLSKNFILAKAFTLDDFFLENPIHNIHLIVLAETGLIGLGAWLYFIFSNIVKSKNEINSNKNQIISLTFIGVLLSYLIYGMAGWAPFAKGVFPFFLLFSFLGIYCRSFLRRGK